MTKRTFFSIVFVILGLLIAFLHWLASRHALYFEWWWFDIMMHFLGGMFIALGALWWIRFELPFRIRERVNPLFITFLMVMIVGISWEIFEYMFGAYSTSRYTLDTTIDLMMNMIGASAMYILFSLYGKR